MLRLEQVYEHVKVIVDFILILIQFAFEMINSLLKKVIKDKPKDISGEIVLVQCSVYLSTFRYQTFFLQKFVKITGTGHGIGRELALLYTASGCEVICIDINKENNDKVVEEANSLRIGTAYGYTYDCLIRSKTFSCGV